MATNQGYDRGDSVSLPVPDGTLSGAPVLVGALPGTTRTKEGEGGNADNYATVDLVGCYRHTVTGATTPGSSVYITSGGALNTTASGNTLWGYALETKGSGAGVVLVRPARV